MCTVTYLPSQKNYGYILTSNRDEKLTRPIASPPSLTFTDYGFCIHPTDATSKGTWFIANNKGWSGVLLNGALAKHEPSPPYKKSRGTLLPTLFSIINPTKNIDVDLFQGVENCTIILVSKNELIQLEWNGVDLHKTELPVEKEHIWSSPTLYTPQMAEEKKDWFSNFLKNHPEGISQQSILHFHTHESPANKEFGLLIEREGIYKTVSVSSVEHIGGLARFQYIDLLNSQTFNKEFEISNN